MIVIGLLSCVGLASFSAFRTSVIQTDVKFPSWSFCQIGTQNFSKSSLVSELDCLELFDERFSSYLGFSLSLIQYIPKVSIKLSWILVKGVVCFSCLHCYYLISSFILQFPYHIDSPFFEYC